MHQGDNPFYFIPYETALIVVDMQRDFCSPHGYAAKAGLDISLLSQPIRQIRLLLDAARYAGLMVVHTREGHRPDLSDCTPEKMRRSQQAGAPIGSTGPLGRLLVRGEYGHDFVDELTPLPHEVVIDKSGYGAFYQTDLELILRNQNVRSLIICGITTEVCVQSTLREAVDRGFRCTTVSDACGSGYPELHRASLAMIEVEGGILGRVARTADIVTTLKPNTKFSHAA